MPSSVVVYRGGRRCEAVKASWMRARSRAGSIETGESLLMRRQHSVAKILKHQRRSLGVIRAQSPGESSIEDWDGNQLQTALNQAIAAEDYATASKLRDQLQKVQGKNQELLHDWEKLGIPAWLAERAAQLGYRFPTDIQKRCCIALQGGGHDILIQSETGSGKTLAFVIPMLSLLDYPPNLFPEDLMGPQMVILTPSMELGVQEAMLIYKLFGGSVNPGIPGASANMFAFNGPRGLKVRGLLNDEEILMSKTIGYLKGVHVLVASPQALAEVIEFPEFKSIFQDLKALAVDEVDACFEGQTKAMEKVMSAACIKRNGSKPTVAFVGATVNEDLADQAAQMGWIEDVTLIGSESTGKVPRGLKHRYIKVDHEKRLAVLCRQLRADIEQQGDDRAPPRVIVFAENEEEAAAAANPLRTSLWGKHRLAVLLPSGHEPIQAMHAFRDNMATFLLATPIASRGLDLPAVSHIYNLGCPDAISYLHRAGRAGRIKSTARGLVTTIIQPDEEDRLKAIAQELGFELQEEAVIPADALPDPGQDIEGAKQGLEDLFNLM